MSDGKLIVIYGTRLRKKNLKYLGYYKLKNKNYEVWDISKVNPDPNSNLSFHDEINEGESLKRISSKKEISESIKEENKNTYYWMTGLHNQNKLKGWICNKIYKYEGRIIEKYKTERIYHIEKNPVKYSKFWTYYRYYKRMLGNVLKRRIKKKTEYVFVPTIRSIRRVDRVGMKTKICPIHTVDYDRYIDAKRGLEKDYDDKCAVFLDQYIPFHFELKNKYGKKWIKPSKYYGELKIFFNRLKEDKSIPVKKIKIALHPNSEKEKVEEYLKGYEICNESTPSEVIKSDMVLSHFSTSALFSVMSKKPVCFFIPKSMAKKELISKTKSAANVFGRKVNTGPPYGKIDYGKNKKRYKKIKKNYIKAEGTKEINSCVYVYEKVVNSC